MWTYTVKVFRLLEPDSVHLSCMQVYHVQGMLPNRSSERRCSLFSHFIKTIHQHISKKLELLLCFDLVHLALEGCLGCMIMPKMPEM